MTEKNETLSCYGSWQFENIMCEECGLSKECYEIAEERYYRNVGLLW